MRTLIRNLQRCLEQSKGSTREYLAALPARRVARSRIGSQAGSSRGSISVYPGLSYRLKLPLLRFIHWGAGQWRGAETSRAQVDSRSGTCWAQPAIERNELRGIARGMFGERTTSQRRRDCPPVRIPSDDTLRFREPDLCRQIAARRRASSTAVSSARPLYSDLRRKPPRKHPARPSGSGKSAVT